MDPLVVLDCQKVLPDRFALTLAAAARSRALLQGAGAMLDMPGASPAELALHEIAAGLLTRDEIAAIPPEAGRAALPPPGPAAASSLPPQGKVH